MHHAPPVSYPVERLPWVGWLNAGLGAAGVTVVAWWSLQAGPPGLRSLAVVPVLALAGVALRHWSQTPAGVLSWDGRAWHWSAREGAPGQVAACLDFQRVLLLRWQPAEGRAHWLWLQGETQPQRWADLRRAVYSRANPDALPEADSPAANP